MNGLKFPPTQDATTTPALCMFKENLPSPAKQNLGRKMSNKNKFVMGRLFFQHFRHLIVGNLKQKITYNI
jgi:hypothetical protein